MITAWLLAAAAIVAFAGRRNRGPRVDVLFLLAGFAFAAQRVQRLVPLFFICTVQLLAPAISPWRGSPAARLHDERAHRWINIPLALLFTAFGVYAALPHLTCIPPLPSHADPLAAAALKAAQARGRAIVEFNWGEYAIWHLGPRLLVSVDGRRETVYSPARLEEFFDVASGSPAGLHIVARDKPDYIWMRTDRSGLRNALAKEGYRIDVITPQSFVAVRSDRPVLMPAADSQQVRARCFPGP
jgi:hypothetical protein